MRQGVPHLLPPPHPPARPRRRLVLPLLPLHVLQVRSGSLLHYQEAQAVPAGPDQDRGFLQDPAEPGGGGVVGAEEEEAEARGGAGGVQEEEETTAFQPQRGPRQAALPDGVARNGAHGHRRRLQQPAHLPARHGTALRQPRRVRGRRDAGAAKGRRGDSESVQEDEGERGVSSPPRGLRPRRGVHGGGGPVHQGPDHHHRVRRRRGLPAEPGARRRRQHDDAALGVLPGEEPRHLPRQAQQHRALHQRHQQPHAGGEEEAEPQVRAVRRRRRLPCAAGGEQGHLQGGEALLRLQWLRTRVPDAPFCVSSELSFTAVSVINVSKKLVLDKRGWIRVAISNFRFM